MLTGCLQFDAVPDVTGGGGSRHLVVVRPHAPNELIIAPRKAFLASSNQLPPGAGADPRATLQGYVVVATGPCAVRAARP